MPSYRWLAKRGRASLGGLNLADAHLLGVHADASGSYRFWWEAALDPICVAQLIRSVA